MSPLFRGLHTLSSCARTRQLLFLLGCLLAAGSANRVQAQGTLDTYVGTFGTGGFLQHSQTNMGPSLSDMISNGPSTATASVTYGGGNVGMDVLLPGGGGSSSSRASDDWSDSITVNASNPALNGTNGTAHLVFHARGALAVTFSGDNSGHDSVYYVIGFNGNSVSPTQIGYQQDCPNCTVPLSNYDSFSVDLGITFGSQTNYSVSHAISVSQTTGSSSPASTYADLTLGQDSFVVVDGGNNPVGFTSTSFEGTAMGQPRTAGSSYAGLSLTNDTNNNHHGSTLSMLGGVAGADTYVHAAFMAPPPVRDGAIPVSDAVGVNGTNNDPVVIQLTYDAALAQSIFGSVSGLGLAWFDPVAQIMRNAVLGNTGGTLHFVNGAYDPASDFHLGYYGIDVAHSAVWAVVNHNSEFVVTDLDLLQARSITHLANGAVYLKFAGAANAVNHVQMTSDLNSGAWSTVADVVAGPSGVVSFQDADAGGATRGFYRIISPQTTDVAHD